MLKSTLINLNNDCVVSAQVIENLYKTCVQNRVCKCKDEFYCYLCKFVANELVFALKHIQHDKEHQERNKIGEINTEMLSDLHIDEIESVKIVLNGLVVINMQQFHCIICTSNLSSLKDVDIHIQGKRHKNNKEAKPVTSNASSLCSSISNVNILDAIENLNILNNVMPIILFNCNICKMSLKNNAQYKYHKMFHLSPVRYSYCNIDIINFSLQEDKTRFMHCSICDQIFSDEEELEKHLSDTNHCKWLNFLQCLQVFVLSDDLAIHLINLDIDCNITAETPSFTKALYCQVCELSTPYSDNPKVFAIHENGTRHQKNLISPSIQDKNFESTSITYNCVSTYVCFICNIEFSDEKSLYIHYNEGIHQFRAKVLYALANDKYLSIPLTVKDNVTIDCTICNIETVDVQSMLVHIFGSKHKKNTKANESWSVEINNKSLNINLKSSVSLSTWSSDLNNPFCCPVCKVKAPSDIMLTQHLESQKHKKKVNHYNETNHLISAQEFKLFSCPICAIHFSTDTELIQHFEDLRHQESIKVKNKNKNKFADSVNAIVEISASNSSLNSAKQFSYSDDVNDSDVVNSILDEDIVFDTEKNEENSSSSLQKKRKQRRRPKNILSMPSLENLAKIGERYIELCIESGTKNIYNVDKNKMYKLRLGITLSFQIDDGVMYCIPCNTEMSSNLHIFYEHLRTEKHVEKITEIVTNDKPYPTDLKDRLSDFRLACSYMKKLSEKIVICLACAMEIENSNINIHDHMNIKTHINNCRPLASFSEIMFQKITKFMQAAWYFAEKFICKVCSVNCASEVDFAKHLMQDQHIEKANQASIDGDVHEFDMCTICATYWFGKTDYFTIHCNESFHKNLIESRDYVIPKLMGSVKDILNHYEDTISSLLQESYKIDENVEKVILNLLEMILQDRYPKVKAHLFGSRLARISSDDRDLDIYLDCENTYSNFKSAKESQEQLLEVQKCLKEYEDMWTIEEVLLIAKIPVIKLRLRSTNRCCNVQCINGLCVEKSNIIRYFVENYPACRKLILLLKKWMFFCGLSGQHGITNYTVSMLVIFYLQTENILPSLLYLIQQKNQSKIVAGWETGFFADKIAVPEEKYTMKDHLSRFFDYYAKFNYITKVICPFLGRSVLKRDFVNFDKLPEEMNIYKSLYESGNAQIFRFDSPMCVQDPVELSENLTQSVKKLHLRTFQHYCLESKSVMDKV